MAGTATGRCPLPCGKIRYTSRASAKITARNHARRTRLSVYPCLYFEFWHVTSKMRTS
jgi:hypothetical protein